MKFSNGYWLNKEGVIPHSPIEPYEVIDDDNSLTIYAPCKKINRRGDTTGGPVITVKLSSPVENVIRVQLFHNLGVNNHGPNYDINIQNNNSVQIFNTDKEVGLTSGTLSAKIAKDKLWSLDFYRGNQKITSSENRSMAYLLTDTGTYMREQLSLSVGELVYGLGERFTPFVKNGQSVDVWNEDGGTGSEQAYKNIPFYVTNKGYGVFVNHPEKVSLEIGAEKVAKVQFSVEGESLDYFIIDGPSIKEVLSRYTLLTGRPSLPPAWSFGLWLSTSFLTNYDEKTVTSFVDGMSERDIPLSVFHFDCFWMKDYHWCDFKWDKRVFPDPKGMLKRLKAKGLKICVWINPYISQQSSLFNEAYENGYLIKRPNGDVWQWDMWQPGMGIVDFTNPKACKWFEDKLSILLDMGVDCFKTDFGERIPMDAIYYDKSDPKKMHNYYTYLYNELVYNLLIEKKGKREAILFARSATVGGQKFPVHWGGDCSANYVSMAESLRGGLSLCMSGFGFWSHDIGGFEKTSSADVYKRWVAFGLLSTHSRLHGAISYRVPWAYDEEAVEVLRYFVKLKCSLMPYLFSNAYIASKYGIPVMRAMVMEFQDDPSCEYLDRQYMLGESLLVAPVFNENGDVTYYLPSGKWTNFFTNEQVNGGCWRKEQHNYMSIPLMVRQNSIIAIGSTNNRPDYNYDDNVTLHVFEIEENKKLNTSIYNTDGNREFNIEIIRENATIKINYSNNKPFCLVLRNIFNITAIKGATIEKIDVGTKINPLKNNNEIVCELTA